MAQEEVGIEIKTAKVDTFHECAACSFDKSHRTFTPELHKLPTTKLLQLVRVEATQT